jgi:hypothetical protein
VGSAAEPRFPQKSFRFYLILNPKQATRDEFNYVCSRLSAAHHVAQWQGYAVWKVGGKVFAICDRKTSKNETQD